MIAYLYGFYYILACCGVCGLMAWQINIALCVSGITDYYIKEVWHIHLEPIKSPNSYWYKIKERPQRTLSVSSNIR